jgi:hypothetical protein
MKGVGSCTLLLLLLVGAGSSYGCATAAGFAMGSAADRDKGKVARPLGSVQEIRGLEPGTPVELQLRDERRLRGRYQGLDTTVTDGLIARYRAAGDTLSRELGLPATGPGAQLELRGPLRTSGELIGYTPDAVIFKEGERSPLPVPLYRIVSVTDAAGRTLTGRDLERRLGKARTPVVASLKLEQDGKTTLVPSEDIVAVSRLVTPSSATKKGILIGAIVDVALVVLAVATYDP